MAREGAPEGEVRVGMRERYFSTMAVICSTSLSLVMVLPEAKATRKAAALRWIDESVSANVIKEAFNSLGDGRLLENKVGAQLLAVESEVLRDRGRKEVQPTSRKR